MFFTVIILHIFHYVLVGINFHIIFFILTAVIVVILMP